MSRTVTEKTVTDDGQTYLVQITDMVDPEYRNRKTRVYSTAPESFVTVPDIKVEDFTEDECPTKEREDGTKYRTIYTRRGECPAVDKAFDRHNASIIAAKRRALAVALSEDELARFGKLAFSRRGGCSCGCSPAFIAAGSYGREVFVSVAPITKGATV